MSKACGVAGLQWDGEGDGSALRRAGGEDERIDKLLEGIMLEETDCTIANPRPQCSLPIRHILIDFIFHSSVRSSDPSESSRSSPTSSRSSDVKPVTKRILLLEDDTWRRGCRMMGKSAPWTALGIDMGCVTVVRWFWEMATAGVACIVLVE